MTTIHLVRRVGPLAACMGGFCTCRDSCGRYWQRDTRQPAERLCERGTSTQWRPIAVTPPAGAADRLVQAREIPAPDHTGLVATAFNR
jgi:hypothetical protein